MTAGVITSKQKLDRYHPTSHTRCWNQGGMLHGLKSSRSGLWVRRTPPPCNSGIMGIEEDPNIITVLPYSHYCWVKDPSSFHPFTTMIWEFP